MSTLKLLSNPHRTVSQLKQLKPVTWCVRGMKVYARAPWPKRGWVLCVVTGSSGYRARVKNELHGIDAWLHIDGLRVSKDSYFAML